MLEREQAHHSQRQVQWEQAWQFWVQGLRKGAEAEDGGEAQAQVVVQLVLLLLRLSLALEQAAA